MLSLILGVAALHAADDGKIEAPSTLLREPRSVAVPAGKNLWRTSVAALAVSDVLDVHSSWGKRESNPLLSGGGSQFGYQGALIKVGIQSGLIAMEYLVLRRHPSKGVYRAFSLMNFGGASTTGVVAIRNYRIPQR